ncbi:MAG: YeeE/YedE thiosulfate transporter family protein [Thermoguttaceae bacterium]
MNRADFAAEKASVEEPKSSPLWNPYLAGIALGLTLLASLLTLGAGLGASGGIARIGAQLESWIAPSHVAASEYFGAWGLNPLSYYLVFMFAGTFLGGWISALLAGRFRLEVEKGAAVSSSYRLGLALAGGVLAGYAARIAGGCTSGQALSGGAMLLTGSLIFMGCVFAGGYAAAWFVRRQWND